MRDWKNFFTAEDFEYCWEDALYWEQGKTSPEEKAAIFANTILREELEKLHDAGQYKLVFWDYDEKE